MQSSISGLAFFYIGAQSFISGIVWILLQFDDDVYSLLDLWHSLINLYWGFAWPLTSITFDINDWHQWQLQLHSTISPFVIDGNTHTPLVIMLFFFLSTYDINGKGNSPWFYLSFCSLGVLNLMMIVLVLISPFLSHEFTAIYSPYQYVVLSSILYLSPLLMYLMACGWRCFVVHNLPMSNILLQELPWSFIQQQ